MCLIHISIKSEVGAVKPVLALQLSILLNVPRRYFLGRSFMFLCLVFVMPLCASVYLCLVITCWERADLSKRVLVCGV